MPADAARCTVSVALSSLPLFTVMIMAVCVCFSTTSSSRGFSTRKLPPLPPLFISMSNVKNVLCVSRRASFEIHGTARI